MLGADRRKYITELTGRVEAQVRNTRHILKGQADPFSNSAAEILNARHDYN
jgi:hypothetical protein